MAAYDRVRDFNLKRLKRLYELNSLLGEQQDACGLKAAYGRLKSEYNNEEFYRIVNPVLRSLKARKGDVPADIRRQMAADGSLSLRDGGLDQRGAAVEAVSEYLADPLSYPGDSPGEPLLYEVFPALNGHSGLVSCLADFLPR
jgi:hypothetical protein